MAAGGEFVEGWLVAQVLGEGAYGEHGARERLLSRVCGTVPYAAPEVLQAAARPYRAPPADLWAAALVLLAMLAGELPWERADDGDPRYAAWSAWARGDGDAARGLGPWRKLSGGALALLRGALQPLPERRVALDALLLHAWSCADEGSERAARSQPAAREAEPGGARELSAADMDALISYSQPAHAADLLLAPGARRTRLRLRVSPADALTALGDALAARGWPWRRAGALELAADCGAVQVRAGARRGPGGAGALLELRRWRGCGLQFKRRFVELRDALRPLAAPGDEPEPMQE